MLQVFLFGCCVCFTNMFASAFDRMLHIFCNSFSSVLGVFASVSDACFKCFIFLQTHVTKVEWVLYMLQCDSPATAVWCNAGAACMRVRSGKMERCKATGEGSGAGRPCLARACSSRGHPDAGIHPLPSAGVQQPWASGHLGASTALVSISSCVLRLIQLDPFCVVRSS
jgi:hypothetical protein